MRHWSNVLSRELGDWPQVNSRPMFGLVGFYRKGAIFAALPRTRALGTPNSLIFKFDPMPRPLLQRAKRDSRIGWERGSPEVRWYSFELRTVDDIRDGLWWLNRAYEAAK